MKKIFYLAVCLILAAGVKAQDVNVLLQQVRVRMEVVNDYTASATMKTNVTFLKVPVSNVKVYFKKPNKLRIKSDKGVSFVPKGAVSINLNNLVAGSNYTVLDAGTDKIDGVPVKVVKLLPTDENSDVVLSTLYIDATKAVIKRAKTTTRDNGTYELNMTYGRYIAYGLPDKVLFSFNARDYKLPKGVTFDFDDGASKPAGGAADKNKKGSAEITFTNYDINKGVSDSVFQ